MKGMAFTWNEVWRSMLGMLIVEVAALTDQISRSSIR